MCYNNVVCSMVCGCASSLSSGGWKHCQSDSICVMARRKEKLGVMVTVVLRVEVWKCER